MPEKTENPSLVVPLLMNVFLFPGSGQWVLKKRISAFIFIFVALTLSFLLTIEIYHTIETMLPDLVVKTEQMDLMQTFVEVQIKVHEQIDFSKTGYLFLFLVATWFFAIIDLLRIGIQRKETP
ncbi:MAG: hypothetical protein HQK84_08895 [Nitrospinae bacterium]|nr:hypothetical protein [Nitrospinota bacterium]